MYVILEILYTIGYLLYCFVESLVQVLVPAKRKSLAGKFVLVTGAGQGIGREVAKQFSALGARLVLWDIRKVKNYALIIRDWHFSSIREFTLDDEYITTLKKKKTNVLQ